MGKGSKTQKTEVSLPPFLEDAAEANLDIGNEVAAMGYVPYQGPTIAGFSPMQEAALGNINQSAKAFGMNMPSSPRGVDPFTGIQNQYRNRGGWSPYGLYNQQQGNIPDFQRRMIESFVIDPRTGASPTNPAVPQPQFTNGMAPMYPGGATQQQLSPYEQYVQRMKDARGGRLPSYLVGGR